jgi:hypothetical protein
MTGEQLRELIVDAMDKSTQLIDFGDFTVSETDFDAAAVAVLAAIRAAGIVIGERANYDDVSDEAFDGDPDNWDGLIAEYAKSGLALVRVVE